MLDGEREENAEDSFSLVKSPKKKKCKHFTNATADAYAETPLDEPTKSFLLFKIIQDDAEEADIREDLLMDTVRAIFKVILCSSNHVGIIAPPQFNLPVITDNRQLPKKLDTKAIRKFVHYGRMTPKSFTGKILIEHASRHQSDFFTKSAEMLKLMDSCQGSSIQVDRFGDCKIAKIGFLVGALSQESRESLTQCIEQIIWTQTGHEIPILVSREKVFKEYGLEGDKVIEFVWATSVKCRETESELVTNILIRAFGRPSPESNYF